MQRINGKRSAPTKQICRFLERSLDNVNSLLRTSQKAKQLINRFSDEQGKSVAAAAAGKKRQNEEIASPATPMLERRSKLYQPLTTISPFVMTLNSSPTSAKMMMMFAMRRRWQPTMKNTMPRRQTQKMQMYNLDKQYKKSSNANQQKGLTSLVWPPPSTNLVTDSTSLANARNNLMERVVSTARRRA